MTLLSNHPKTFDVYFFSGVFMAMNGEPQSILFVRAGDPASEDEDLIGSPQSPTEVAYDLGQSVVNQWSVSGQSVNGNFRILKWR